MAFCGQCGLLLTTNTTQCPRCGTATDFNTVAPGTPVDDNSATIIARSNNTQSDSAPYTPSPPPLPSDTRKGYYPATDANEYSQQSAPQSSSYPTPGAFQPDSSQSANGYKISPDAPPQQSYQTPGMHPPGVIPTTNPSYPFQQPIPPYKPRKWPIILIIVLIVALLAITVLFFTVGSHPLVALFETHSTPTTQVIPTTQPATSTTQQNTSTTQPSSTPLATATTVSTQQAQATVQQYYADINNHAYQDAYNLWVSNPDNYTHYKQGFAQTQHDAITLGNAVPQTDGTIQVNITVQATENTAGGGTKTTTYQGYYIVGQQTNGSWKIITAYLA